MLAAVPDRGPAHRGTGRTSGRGRDDTHRRSPEGRSSTPTMRVLGIGQGIVLAEEGHLRRRRATTDGLLYSPVWSVSGLPLALEGDEVEVLGQVPVPGVVAAPEQTSPDESGSQAGPPKEYSPGRQVAGRLRPVGGHHVEVPGPVVHPVLAVEPGEEPGDLAGRLLGRIALVVAGIERPRGEGQVAARPGTTAAPRPLPSWRRRSGPHPGRRPGGGAAWSPRPSRRGGRRRPALCRRATTPASRRPSRRRSAGEAVRHRTWRPARSGCGSGWPARRPGRRRRRSAIRRATRRERRRRRGRRCRLVASARR